MVAHACARGRRPDGAAHTRAPFKYVGPARLCKTQQRPPSPVLWHEWRGDGARPHAACGDTAAGCGDTAVGRARRRGAVAHAACGDGARSPQMAPLLSAAWHRWSEAGCWPAVRGTWRPVASAAGRGHGARPPRRLGECTDEGGRGVGSRIADTPSGSRTHVTTIADAEHTHTWLAMAGGTTTHP